MKRINLYRIKFICKDNLSYVITSIFLLLLSIFICQEPSYAKLSQVNSKSVIACDEALKTIQPLNIDKLDVYIGDLYNIVDTDGNLNGYSLGFYVGNEPYGYAIYGIKEESIREFVFNPGIENLYKELESKAEECDEIDENKLIDGIVYDGGIDYSIFDTSGEKINYIDEEIYYSNNGDCENETNKEDDYCVDNVEAVLNSSYVAPGSGYYSGDIWNMCDSADYWNVHNNNDFLGWNIVPDSGLTMITESYSKKNNYKYCCTITSVVGILNWFGYTDVKGNYDKIWNNNPVVITSESNGVKYGGCFLKPIADYLNKNYFKDTSTVAYMDTDVSFEDIVDNISTYKHGERVPLAMSIWINRYDPVKGEYIKDRDGKTVQDAHTVTVLSYMKTKQANYVGIFNNWGLDSRDNVVDDSGLKSNISNSSSYLSVRYINFDDLKNRDNTLCEAMMFKNASSKNIKEFNIVSDSGSSTQAAFLVPNGTKYVICPTWTVANGRDDMFEHKGVIEDGRLTKLDIPLYNHNNESGEYYIEINAYDENYKLLAKSNLKSIHISPRIYNVRFEQQSINGYTIQCELPRETKTVKFPTWRSEDGKQVNLKWYMGDVIEDNTLKCYKGKFIFNISDFGNVAGKYMTHIYAYDASGKLITSYGNIPAVDIVNRKKIESARIAFVTSDTYDVRCYVPTGTKYVHYYTYPNNYWENVVCTNSIVNSVDGYINHRIYIKNHRNMKD